MTAYVDAVAASTDGTCRIRQASRQCMLSERWSASFFVKDDKMQAETLEEEFIESLKKYLKLDHIKPALDRI